jgi:hypothetical protein
MTEAKGSCLCGAVTFTVYAAFEHFFLCHCQRCRKGSGSAHAANIFAADGIVTWLTGADCVTAFTVPGTRHSRAFCATCGTPLPHRNGALLVVPAGALDTAVPLRPQAHICAASCAEWDDDLAALPRLEGLPGA